MKVIGITGTSGSGKSTVSGWLREWGYPVLDGDAISRELATPGSPYVEALVREFGPGICDESGALARQVLGLRVFADPEGLRRLTEITTPLILAELRRRIEAARRQGFSVVFLDGALIIDTPFEALCDKILLVEGDRAGQIERIARRDGISLDAARQRLDSQQSSEKLRRRADYLLENRGTLEELRGKTEQILKTIKGMDS